MAKSVAVDFLLNLQDSDFAKGIDEAKGSVTEFVTSGAALSAGGAILGKLGGAAVTMGSEFADSFAKVSTLFGDVEVDTTNLKDKVLDLSSATGVSANELNEGLYSALSAGIPVTEDMAEATDFLGEAVKLATAGFTTTEKSVDVATTVLNAYGLEASETANVMDTLITTQNAGKTTVDELASSLGGVIPSASSLNVNFQELSASMAIMTANGINTAESTTQLKALFNEMNDSGSDVNTMFEELNGQGISEFLANGGSLQEVLGILNTALGENNQKWGDILGSSEAVSAAQTLMKDGGDALGETYKRMTDDVSELDEAYVKMQTPSQNFAKIQEGLKNVLISLGDNILGVLNPALQFFGEHMNIIGPIIVGVTIALATFLVVVGAVGLAATAGTAIMGAFTTAISLIGGALATLFSPITLIVGALALLGTAIYKVGEESGIWAEMWKQINTILEPMKASLTALTLTIKEVVKSFTEWVKETGLINGAIILLRGAAQLVADVIVFLVSVVAKVITKVAQATTEFLTWARSNDSLQKIMKIVAEQINKVVTFVIKIVNVVAQAVASFIKWVAESTLLQKALELINKAISSVVGFAKKLIDAVLKIVASYMEWASESKILEKVMSLINDAIKSVIKFIGNFITKIGEVITKIKNWIVTNQTICDTLFVIKSTIEKVIATASKYIGKITEVIGKIFNWITTNETLREILGLIVSIVGRVISIVGTLIGIVVTIVGKFLAWVAQSEAVQTILNIIIGVIGGVITGIGKLIGWVADIIGKFIDWIGESEGVQDAISGITGFIGGLVEGIKTALGWIDNLLGKLGELAGKALNAAKNLNPFKGGGSSSGGGSSNSPTPNARSARGATASATSTTSGGGVGVGSLARKSPLATFAEKMNINQSISSEKQTTPSVGSNVKTESKVFNFEELVLPNVTDFESFKNDIDEYLGSVI